MPLDRRRSIGIELHLRNYRSWGGVMGGPGDQDGKLAALAASRCVNPHPENVTDARFTAGGFFDARDLVQVNYEAARPVREDDLTVPHPAPPSAIPRPTLSP